MMLAYYGTWTDCWCILEDWFARGDLRAYWDAGPHERPEAQPFTTLTVELKLLLQRRPRLFLCGGFSTHPPLFRRQESGIHAGKFYLSENGGGPLIIFDPANELPLETPTLGVGSLSIQPRYQIEPDHWEKASAALKVAYADLVKRMKRRLTRHEGIWITADALRLLRLGQVQLPAGLAARAASRSTGSTPPAPPVPRAAAGK